FFQAEDGIRDLIVTGVQTCALPISSAHGPAAGRHSNVAGSKVSAGQVGLDPVQSSATSQGPDAGRHTVVAGSSWQLEEQQSPSSRFPSSHCSSGSRTPSLQRRTSKSATASLVEPVA